MKVEIIPCLKDNYSYVIIDERSNKTCVVDPSESKPIIEIDTYPPIDPAASKLSKVNDQKLNSILIIINYSIIIKIF